jgi:hypothetical protein
MKPNRFKSSKKEQSYMVNWIPIAIIIILAIGFFLPLINVLTVSVRYNNQNDWNAYLVTNKLPVFQYLFYRLGVLQVVNPVYGSNPIIIQKNDFNQTYYIGSGTYTISTYHGVSTNESITVSVPIGSPPSRVFIVG